MKDFNRFTVRERRLFEVIYTPEGDVYGAIGSAMPIPRPVEVVAEFDNRVEASTLAINLNAAYNHGFQHGRKASRDLIMDALGFPNLALDGDPA